MAKPEAWRPAPLFARLRADRSALGRVKRFLDNAGHGFGAAALGVIVAGGAPCDDAATLAALRAAWVAHHGDRPRETPESRVARAERRLAELAVFAAPERAAASETAYRYLDIGAAEGDITAVIARALGLPRERAVAADITPQARRPEFDFALADGVTLPFPDASFDLITMLMSAHHFRRADAVFAEAARVARPGARLILAEHARADRSSEAYYDFIHAFYAVVQGAEATPEAFAAQYAAGRYAAYRAPAAWAALARRAGFAAAGATAPRRDSFDRVYLRFVRGAAGASAPSPSRHSSPPTTARNCSMNRRTSSVVVSSDRPTRSVAPASSAPASSAPADAAPADAAPASSGNPTRTPRRSSAARAARREKPGRQTAR